MSADEPALLGALDRPWLGLCRAFIGPERRGKRLAVLVDGERMKGIFVVLAQSGVEEWIGRTVQPGQGNAERTDGVEHAEEFDRNGLRKFQHPGFLEAEITLAVIARRDQFADRALAGTPIAHEELVDAERRAALQQTTLRDESGKASCRVGAATETEDEDLVAGPVVLHQPFIGAGDRGIDAGAEHAAADLLAKLGTEPGRVKAELCATIGADGCKQRPEAPDIGVVADLIPGAVQE